MGFEVCLQTLDGLRVVELATSRHAGKGDFLCRVKRGKGAAYISALDLNPNFIRKLVKRFQRDVIAKGHADIELVYPLAQQLLADLAAGGNIVFKVCFRWICSAPIDGRMPIIGSICQKAARV